MRDAREEVVLDLIIQAAVQHAELRAADVRRRGRLLLEEPESCSYWQSPAAFAPSVKWTPSKLWLRKKKKAR